MYVPKILVEQVVKLFIDEPDYRDNRSGTIERIVSEHYLSEYGKSIFSDFKLMTDIDRAFRYIQQFEPNLRGKNWLKRQRQGGKISKSHYESFVGQSDDSEDEFEDEIKSKFKQLDLFTNQNF